MRTTATLTLTLGLFLVTVVAWAAVSRADGKKEPNSEPEGKQKPAEEKMVGPVLINFGTLPGRENMANYKMTLTILAADGSGLKSKVYNIAGGTAQADVELLVRVSLGKAFKLEEVGVAGLLIHSYDSKPIGEVQAKLEGLPKGTPGPTITRIETKDKTEK